MQQAVLIPDDAGVTTIELITPEIAGEMLKKNTRNRGLKSAWVSEIARRIIAGRFRLTHQGIALACDGTVIDGQHRLHAIVKACKPVLIRVTRGLPREAQWDIDNGKMRRVGDEIVILTGKSGKPRQALAQVLADNFDGLHANTLADSIRTLEMFGGSVDFVTAAGYCKRVSVAPVQAAIVLAHKIDRERVESFYRSIITGVNLDVQSPGLALRENCLKGNWRSDKVSRRLLFGYACRAVDAHLNGERMRILKVSMASVVALGKAHGLSPSFTSFPPARS